ncbi:MAG: Arylsulfatase family protein [Acidimicrobiales bacterium]|nr:Arylsulfatase family protein [Acidimicrobiales bacterium]
MPAAQFRGVIGDDWRDSTPWWPEARRPPTGAPNVLLVVLDDVGFAQLGCYGSDIATPAIDGLAAHGVRLTGFHTTGLCSPTRACLLTGRNHHRNGLGRVAELAVGFPGYDGEIPEENGFLSEVLRQAGYATYAVGKWHLTPDDETHMGAPRHSWPLSRGFDRWYGFHGGETHQFVPALYHDNHSIAPPRSAADGYHLSADLADQAIAQLADLRAVDVDRPFFMYFCTGACHSPHHAPREWIERYHGHFDQGWDRWRDETFARQVAGGLVSADAEMAPRPPWVPAWDDLAEDQRRVAARFMECFAAYLSYTDAQLARLLDFLESTGDRDDTLIVLVSDNGASAEGGVAGSINDVRVHNVDPTGRAELAERIDELGGPTAHNNYPWGWTMAGNTPFKRWKREVHEGGVADPCIISWPGGLGAAAGVRSQFTHAVDVMPTVLELAGIAPPETIGYVPQTPLDGVSFADLLRPGGEQARGRHTTQYFEMFGSRALYHDGWKAVTFKPIGPLYDDGLSWNAPFSEDRWELYHVTEDPAEIYDLAAAHPDRLADLVERWWVEARRNQVLPLDNRVLHALVNPKPDRRRPRLSATYRPGTSPVPEAVAIDVKNRGHVIEVDLTVAPGAAAEGVLLAQGSALGGFSLHLVGGHLRYVHNLYGRARHVLDADRPVGPGRHRVTFRLRSEGAGTGGPASLEVDGEPVAEGQIPAFTVAAFSLTGAGLTCGYELGPAIGEGYDAPFCCTATIHSVTVTLSEHAPVNPLVEFERIMSEQ